MAEEFIEVSEEEFLGEPPSGAEEFIEISDEEFNAPGEEVGTSFSKEVSQLGPAFKESLGRPLENMGEGFEVVGFQGVANALKGAITEPENYVSAAERFMEPQPGESQFLGFAWQYAPRAAVEQTGQALAAIGGRVAGAVAGGLVAGPPGAIAGGFVGPAIIGAAQVIGPVAKERARNNGREVPTNQDLAAATLTAIGSGALDAIGARYLPGGDKATGKFFKRVASSFVGEGLLTEAPQSVIEQVGSTAGTEAGLNINAKQALGEGIIGGTTAAGLQAITYPLTKEPKNQVIRTPEQAEEIDIQAKSNEEAVSLMGQPADQDKNELISRVNEIEKVVANNETLINSLEPNDETRKQLELENKIAKQEAGRLKGELEKSVGLAPIPTAEQQQVELAKQIAAPVEPAPAEVPAAPVSETITPAVEAAPVTPAPAEVPAITPAPVAETPAVAPAPEVAPARLYLNVPFNRKEAAKSAGAKFDAEKKLWYIQRSPTGEMPPIAPSFIKEAEATTFSAKELEPARINAEAQLGQEVEIGSFELPAGTAYGLKIKGGDWLNKNINLEIDRQRTKVEPIAETADELYSRLAKNKEDEIRKEISEIKKGRKNPKSKWYGARDSEISKREREIGSLQFGDWGIVVDAFDAELAAKKPVSDVWNELFIKQRLSPNEFQARLDRAGYTKQGDLYVYQPTPATPAAEPTGISVGNRIKLGKSPQTYTVEQVIPQSETERGLGEQFYSVKNERTGEVQTVESKDLKLVKPSKATRKMSPVRAEEEYTPVPEAERYSFVDAANRSIRFFGGTAPENFIIVNDSQNKDYEMKAGYDPDSGEIILNRAYIRKGENIEDILTHELGHYIYSDPQFQKEFQNFLESMPDDVRAEIDEIVNEGYSKETNEVQIEERQVMAFASLVRKTKRGRTAWEKVKDVIKKIINRLLKTNIVLSDHGAMAVFNVGYKRFNSGERIIREMQAGKLKMAPEPPKKPAEPAAAPKEKGRRERIMGVEAGPLIKTQDGIIAKTKEKLKTLFDPDVVNESNTATAYRAIGILSGSNRDAARQYAESINALTAEGLGEDADSATEISMGASLFVNNLFEYAVKLAAKGDRKMLGIMVSNINRMPTGQAGASDAGRTLRARVELKARFLLMAQAEQDAFTNYVAEFLYGPNPSQSQINSIKTSYAATQKVKQPTEEELVEEIAAVGEKTGVDLVKKINDDFTKAAEEDVDARNDEIDQLTKEYNQLQNRAENEIEKLATIQSDTPSFVQRKKNEIRAIVSEDLKQRPDMGRKAPWKSMLVAKLQNAGVNQSNAETLADLVWRQHEINNLSRELESINKAVQKGPISELIKQIKDTPLEQQQDPKWRFQVMRDYLRKAGLSMAQAERIAKLMDISLQKRFTEAKEQAFTDAIKRTAPWKAGNVRSKRAFEQLLQAIRAGALDPSRNFISDIAARNGWTGFSDTQYSKLIKLDAILANPESSDADKAEAHKEVQNIISKAKLPIRARDIIGQFYDAQALSGIPTITVNMVSPIGMAAKNALVQAASGVATFRPEQVDAAFKTFIDSIKSWVKTVAYSFKNNVTVYSNVEYLVNDEGLLKLYNRGRDQFKNGKTPRDRADGVKNMMIGMWDYVRRILNALDYGAIAALQNQNVPKYALAAMQAKGMSSKDGAKMLNAMFEAKRNFYENQIAIGTDKNKASVLADEFFVSSWRQALTDAKLPAQEVMDAAINDAMSAVGRTRASLDGFRDENTKLQDTGVTSFPALWLLQTMANAANKSDSQIIKIFSRVIYGFAVVPARVFRETAWFSPYGYVRFAYDAIAKKKGLNSPYAQSLGSDLQYRQRLTEATAGTLVLLGLASALASSTDDEDDKRPFKIVVTGNGPNRADDPQYYDSWIKNNTPNTVTLKFGKVRIPINTMRGFEAFAWPAMMLGAVDDWQIRRKLKRLEENPVNIVGDTAVVAGNVFSAALKRGPYAFAAKPLFEAYGDRTVESLFKSITFPAKTLIPIAGSSILRNASDFLNDPIDRRTLDGALWANVPFIGPTVAPKSLNAFGEPALAGEAADKLFKLGVPIVFNVPNDRDSVNLHDLILKKGGGPSIPTRSEVARRLDRDPTNKEFEMFVKEYGSEISRVMKSRYKSLEAKKPEDYDAEIKKIGDRARDRAERIVKQKAKQP